MTPDQIYNHNTLRLTQALIVLACLFGPMCIALWIRHKNRQAQAGDVSPVFEVSDHDGYTQVTAEKRVYLMNFCFLGHHPYTKWTKPVKRVWGCAENPFTGQKASSAPYPTQFRQCQCCGKQQSRKVK
jgi:hypothetical protein